MAVVDDVDLVADIVPVDVEHFVVVVDNAVVVVVVVDIAVADDVAVAVAINDEFQHVTQYC